MENEEIKNDEVIMDESEEEEIIYVKPGVMIAVGAGLATLVIGGGKLAYNKLGKPVVAKIKAKREAKKDGIEITETEKVSFVDKVKNRVNHEEEPEEK